MEASKKTGWVLDFFNSIPDDILVEIAQSSWDSLESLCDALTIDLQLLKEDSYESSSNRGNLC
jgi:hypothetical protein